MPKTIATLITLLALTQTMYANDTIDSRVLNYELAHRAVIKALEDCSQRGFKVSVALVGRDGHLLAFVRHPMSGAHTIQTAQAKAYSAASLQVPTAGLMQTRPDLNFAPGIVLIQGGLPISVAGHFYGGISVAGADTQTDENCANTGVVFISESLEFAN